MSIVTRTGDHGATGLMYNRRVTKHHPRVEAYGAVDELNAALGLARAQAAPHPLAGALLNLQHDLVILMGELATATEDLNRYAADGFPRVTPQLTGRLDQWIHDLEERLPLPRGWAMPGDGSLSAALDLARTICRRAERRVSALREAEPSSNPEILTYLNRLADLLWLLAREAATGASDRSDPPSGNALPG